MLDCEQRLQQPIQKLSDRESRQNPLKLNLLTGWWGPTTQKESRLFTVISKVFWDRFFWCALSEGHAVGHDGGQFSFLGSFLAVMIFMSYHHSRFFPALVYIPVSPTSSRPQGPRLETLYVKLPDEFDDGTLWGDNAAVSFNLHPFLIFTIIIRDNCLLHPFLNI